MGDDHDVPPTSPPGRREPGPRLQDAGSAVASERARFWTLFERLPPDQREAIFLAHHDGHTYQSVADTLGIPASAVQTRIRLGLRKLRHGARRA